MVEEEEGVNLERVRGDGRTRVGPGDILSARCLLSPSDPPAQLSWTLNFGPLPPNTFPRRSIQLDQDGRRVQISVSGC